MHVELLYTPGCGTFKKAQGALESVIAEERLPIPVHLKESAEHRLPTIMLDGEPLSKEHHCFDEHCMDDLRGEISRRWNAFTTVG